MGSASAGRVISGVSFDVIGLLERVKFPYFNDIGRSVGFLKCLAALNRPLQVLQLGQKGAQKLA
jgi:hypothetical protein